MNWLDAQQVVDAFGPYALPAVALFVFFETAFILTSFLPGDSLLFILGITLATSTASGTAPIWIAILLVMLMAIAGSQAGYELGLKVGPALFERNHNWIFNPKVVKQSHVMFEKYGARAVILARFAPIIRALIPMLAGIGYLERRKFLKYNAIGASAWVVGFMGAGYYLGEVPFIANHLEQTVLAIIVLSSLPLPIELLRHWMRACREKKQAAKN